MDAILDQIRTLSANADAKGQQRIQEQLRDVQREVASNVDLLWGLGSSYMQMALVQTGIDLRVFETLATNTDPISLQHFIDVSHASPTLLAHLIRSMAAFGFIVETDEDTFTANRMTKTLANPDVVGCFPHITEVHALTAQVLPRYLREHKYQALTDTKDLPFHLALGTDLSAFEWMKQNPEQMKALGHAMRIERAHSWVESYPVSESVSSFNPKPDSVLLVDVGGGFGQQAVAFKAAVASTPGRIVVQDLASTLIHAPSLDGIEFQECDFFTPQPIRGARFYYLRHILHDWADEDSLRILQSLLSALSPESRIVIDEVVMPVSKVPWQCAYMDLTMSSSFGGRERSRDEWGSLLSRAGLQIEQVHTYDDVRKHSVIIAVPK